MSKRTITKQIADAANHWKILVGFDGTVSDRDALAWALDVANAFDASILVAHVVGLLEATEYKNHERPFDSVARALQDVIDDVVYGDAPSVELLLQAGDPVGVLLAMIDDYKPQLVVLGRRQSDEIGASWLGSVSRHLVSRSPVPTVVVPNRTRDDNATDDINATNDVVNAMNDVKSSAANHDAKPAKEKIAKPQVKRPRRSTQLKSQRSGTSTKV